MFHNDRELSVLDIWIAEDFSNAVGEICEPEGDLLEVEE